MPGEENGKTENDSAAFAVCLKCGNRWKVRKLDVKKRKCPVCGGYRTKLESELEADNSPVENQEKTEENRIEKVEKEENGTEEQEKNKRTNQEKKPSRKIEDEIEDLDEETIDELISEDEDGKAKKKSKKEKKSKSWLIWIAAAIFIFGLLYWFLSSLGKKRGREVPERQPEQEPEDFGGAIPGLV